MSVYRTKAAQWLHDNYQDHDTIADLCDAMDTALAQPEAQPVAFDHDIGAGRYKVVKGAFWWHIRIGDSTSNVGKFHSKLAAEDMALKLLTAFRDGAFLQYETSMASPPVQAEGTAAGMALLQANAMRRFGIALPVQAEQTQAFAIPNGWTLLPTEPLEVMERAAYDAERTGGVRNYSDLYRAMRDAAPKPNLPPDVRDGVIESLTREIDDLKRQLREALPPSPEGLY